MKFTYSRCENYFMMSQQYYEAHKVCMQELNNLCGDYNSFDLASHTPEENQIYANYRFSAESYAVSSLIFQALAIEAFINFYGVKRIGKSKFDKHYNKIGTLDKIVILVKVVTGHDFPKEDGTYSIIEKLFKARNKLVHSNSKTIDLENSSEQEFIDFTDKNIEFYFEILDDAMESYVCLKNIIKDIEGKELDLFFEQQEELNENIQKNINEMLLKVLGG